jgi:hypothetical protein
MCYFVLRAEAGVHRAGEPMLIADEQGHFIRCPQCGSENREPFDGAADMIRPSDDAQTSRP